MSDLTAHSGPQSVRQISGPGVSGLEHDTTVWHYDVEAADIPTLVSDPAKFFAGTAIAKALSKETPITFVGGFSNKAQCCFFINGVMICHPHTPAQR